MRRYMTGILLLGLVVSSVIVWSQGTTKMEQSVSQRIDHKARIAHQTNNESDIRGAVSEVVDSSVLGRTEWAALIKDRIANAELAFRRGNQRSITEQDVVSTVNKLGARFNAPDYARTSLEQVRMLRMALMATCPNLVGTMPEQDKKVSSSMAPLEATYVVLTLVHQKLYNPAFQVTPGEWHRQGFGSKKLTSLPREQTNPQLQVHARSDKAIALRRLAVDATSHYSGSEIENVVTKSLSDLGIGEVQR